MRGPTREEIQKTPPPELRMGSKTTQAYLDMRQKILGGEYSTNEVLVPKQIEEAFHINNTTTQILLMRLANEGLVKVLPIKEHAWPKNASLNEYRVADFTSAHKILTRREHTLPANNVPEEQADEKETLLLKIQYADAEIATLLGMAEGEKVLFYRERKRRTDKTVVWVSDTYLPFWFAEVAPELEQAGSDVYSLMRQLGKQPRRCTETVEVMHASSSERMLFELSPDDPAPLFKLQRQTCDEQGHPLAVQFLTLKADTYRFQYSFELATEERPGNETT